MSSISEGLKDQTHPEQNTLIHSKPFVISKFLADKWFMIWNIRLPILNHGRNSYMITNAEVMPLPGLAGKSEHVGPVGHFIQNKSSYILDTSDSQFM